MIIEALQALTGYVEFEVGGGFAERFVNLCGMDGVVLRNVQNDGVKVKAFTTTGGFNRMQRAITNSGMALVSSRERGLPQFVKRHKMRLGLCFGALLCVAFIVFMSSFIWDVEVVGNDAVKASDLTEYAACIGVKPGAFKRNIDAKRAAAQIVLNNKGLAWAAVNIFGTKAVIEVREVTPAVEQENMKQPCNIIAAKPGCIIKAESYSGTSAVHENEAVAEGDLLISGIVKNRDGSERAVHAGGRVLAETENRISVKTAFSLTTEICKKTTELCYLHIFGFDIPLNAAPDGEAYGGETDKFKARGESLPLGITRRVFAVYEEKNLILTSEQAVLFSLCACVNKMRSELSNAEIQSLEWQTGGDKNAAAVTLKARCVENIAKISYFEVE